MRERACAGVCVFWFGLYANIGRSTNIRFVFSFDISKMKMRCALQTGCGRQNNALRPPPPPKAVHILSLGICDYVILHDKRELKLQFPAVKVANELTLR